MEIKNFEMPLNSIIYIAKCVCCCIIYHVKEEYGLVDVTYDYSKVRL